ncbi:hypothetical protein JCM8547_006459 [Rhodosporidiobolus lusitaniae]
MPLDSSLFLLLVRPRLNSPGWIDFLVDSSAEDEVDKLAYSAYKDATSGSISLVDPLTSSLLGTHTLSPPSVPNSLPSPKNRLISLLAPPAEVSLKSRSGMSWCWELEWEGVKYEWERNVLGLLGGERGFTLMASRRPDPNYPVASFSPKKKSGSIEFYDYNLARVEPPIQDRKGLEISTLLALSFFIDHLFSLPSSSSADSPSPSPSTVPGSVSSSLPAPPVPPTPPRTAAPPPPLPARPEGGGGRKGRGSMASLDVNEVEVTDKSEGALEQYCEKCLRLLEDPTLLYLSLFTSSPLTVPAVASLAERVKRQRYKRSGEEVMVFVDDSGAGEGVASPTGTGGVTKSDIDRKSDLGMDELPVAPPPSALRIYLSRIELSELLPNHRQQKNLHRLNRRYGRLSFWATPAAEEGRARTGHGGENGREAEEGEGEGGGGTWRRLFGGGGGGAR